MIVHVHTISPTGNLHVLQIHSLKVHSFQKCLDLVVKLQNKTSHKTVILVHAWDNQVKYHYNESSLNFGVPFVQRVSRLLEFSLSPWDPRRLFLFVEWPHQSPCISTPAKHKEDYVFRRFHEQRVFQVCFFQWTQSFLTGFKDHRYNRKNP